MTEAQHILDSETQDLIERLAPLAAELERLGFPVAHPLADAGGLFTVALAGALRPLDDADVRRVLDGLDKILERMLRTVAPSEEAKNGALLFRKMLDLAVRDLV